VKKSILDVLTQKKLQLVFTYAPAGLGHLRVADALYHGLPAQVTPVVLGSRDRSIQVIHRITSIHPLARAAFEWFQSGPLSAWSNRVYRAFLRSDSGLVYEEMTRLLDERFEPPKQMLIVSTHFGLAHKLAAIKERLQKEKRVQIFLAVVVTDDTFQPVWYVDKADLIVVPSHSAQEAYRAYGQRFGGAERIEVIPYPVSQSLAERLDSKALAQKDGQLDAKANAPIGISIPISGAAVGTGYSLTLIDELRKRSERFVFHIVTKDAPYTRSFLAGLDGKKWIDVHAAGTDREVVDAYDRLFEEQVISLEVTKPSEQTFKVLLGTQSRGGVIMLFSEPVGKQEFDNLDFLRRHLMIPDSATQEKLWNLADADADLVDDGSSQLLGDAVNWRGVKLPSDPHKAANFIWWLLRSGVFAQMMTGNAEPRSGNGHPDELGPDGVARFWSLITSIEMPE
jgi:hypothetical protein